LPMSGLLIIFSILFILKEFLQISPILVYVILVLIILILIYVTFILAKKWFNRETLVLSI
jgi:hypothetical protein